LVGDRNERGRRSRGVREEKRREERERERERLRRAPIPTGDELTPPAALVTLATVDSPGWEYSAPAATRSHERAT